ncbi:non-ribosomal peptide synthetase [Teredinibacter turnerae]|uniref:non-ribosomal peptide synthetase n=1 Tax=Teredinibacter turnerae TaxID=2426 RepID=UPI0003722C59|nr:non-ribosomal peptide synthetase [Teredinibacter turnerae]
MNLIEILESRCNMYANRIAYAALRDAEQEECLTYQELLSEAKSVASRLQSLNMHGERALILLPSGIGFIKAFWGCIFAGVLPVPVFTPRKRLEHWQRLDKVALDCGAKALLISQENEEQLLKVQRHQGMYVSQIQSLVIDSIVGQAGFAWKRPDIRGESVAFLQYTSGSTGNPKGVVVTHDNLVHNQMMMAKAFSQSDKSVFVSWLPLYHDMGLIGNVLLTVYLGAECNIMTPASFLGQPYLWLKSISRCRGTSSFAPNFAYQECVNRVTEEQKEDLLLDCWEFALNGAEPIRADTIRDFSASFRRCGFQSNAFYPGYGLAEGTLFVSGGDKGAEARISTVDAELLEKGIVASPRDERNRKELVSSGRLWENQLIKIVDPDSMEEKNVDEVGEIWLQGRSIANGYWNKPQETRKVFNAYTVGTSNKPFLRTGDLGFLDSDNRLYITGRLKELVIIHGRNYYPQDIEYTIQGIDAFRAAGGAAFAIDEGGEKLVVVQELKRTALRDFDGDKVFQEARKRISAEHDIKLHALILIKPATLPKTSSGKIQRKKVHQLFVDNLLDIVVSKTWNDDTGNKSEIVHFPSDEYWCCLDETELNSQLEDWFEKTVTCILRLSKNRVDLDSNLTGLGLESIAAVRLHNEFGIPLEHVLADPTLFQLRELLFARIVRLRSHQNELSVPGGLPAETGHAKSLSLSYNQEAIYSQAQLAQGTGAYHVALPLRIESFNESALTKALGLLIERHDSLRTRYKIDEIGKLRREIDTEFDIPLTSIDASGWSDSYLKSILASSIRSEIKMDRDAVFRVEHYSRKHDQGIILLVFHHIAVDLFSVKQILEDLAELYTASITSQEPVLAEISATYSDFVTEQQEYLDSDKAEESLNYWRNLLAGERAALDLPTVQAREAKQTFEGKCFDLVVPADQVLGLKSLASTCGATLNAVLFSVYQLVLALYSNQKDFCVGIPAAGRTQRKWNNVVGYFVNPLPIRCQLNPVLSFVEHLENTRESLKGALIHQDYPFPLLVDKLDARASAGVSPIYQSLFMLYPELDAGELGPFILGDAQATISRGHFKASAFPVLPDYAQVDISLLMIESDAAIKGRIQFNKNMYAPVLIESLASHFVNLLDAVVANPEAKLADISPYTNEEWTGFRHKWQPIKTSFPQNALVHQLIAGQMRANPRAIALTCDGRKITYGALETRVRKFANYLHDKGIGPECTVGICMRRSVDMVVSILAVLNAGAAYLPIDPDFPESRIRHILNDASPNVVVCHSVLRDKLGGIDNAVVLDQCYDAVNDCADEPVSVDLNKDNAAYIIYTSGSTGNPKGVINTHGAILNRLQWMQDNYTLDRKDCVLQKTSFGFDVSVWEFLWPLMQGATLALAKPNGHRDNQYLSQCIVENSVTTLHFVPSMLEVFLDAIGQRDLSCLRRVICSGEELTHSLSNRFFQLLPKVSLENLYGPTEAAIDVSYWHCRPESDGNSVPIGNPIANIALYVLNEDLNPVPSGVAGQLYIGGVGLARGYMNKPSLTGDRFIPNPFSHEPGARMYATGDLARYRQDGALEYLGRLDFQVKLRGFRIELGEIESTLLELPTVSQAVATVQSDGADQCIAVFCTTASENIDQDDCYLYLKARLPEYMIPAHIVKLDSFPLNTNGKVDRSRLYLPENVRARANNNDVPSRDIELLVANIWSEVLNVSQLTLSDSFFSLGGHSLRANKVISRIKQALSIDVSLTHLFEYPVLRDFVSFLDTRKNTGTEDLVILKEEGEQGALTSAQERLYFLSGFDNAGSIYNMPVIFDIAGKLNVVALKRSVEEVVAKHSIFKTVYRQRDDSVLAEIIPEQNIELEVARPDIGDGEKTNEELVREIIEKEVHEPFDLAKGPLLRATLIEVDSEQYVFILNMHHIVADGESIAIILHEVSEFYGVHAQEGKAEARRKSVSANGITDLGVSYSSYAAWQQKMATRGAFKYQLEYWRKQLEAPVPIVTLPTDKVRPERKTYNGATIDVTIPSALTGEIRHLSSKTDATMFMVMLAAFKILLKRYSSQNDIAVGVPVSNRQLPETETMVGLFVNTLTLRTQVDDELSFLDYLKVVKSTVLAGFANQDVPFEKVVKEVCVDRNTAYTPLFQVMFSVQESPGTRLKLDSVACRPKSVNQKLAKFDLTLSLEDKGSEVTGYLEYNTDLYTPQTAERVLEHYQTLLASLVSSPELQIANVAMASYEEKQKVLHDWSGRQNGYPDLTIHQLFSKQAVKSPDAIAVQMGDQILSYRELDSESDKLACHILDTGWYQDQLIGVCLDRSPKLIVSLLGILKAGAGYLPIDPDYPQDRINFILQDAGVRLLIAKPDFRHKFRDFSGKILNGELMGVTEKPAFSARFPEASPRQLAYVNYTSGTTGQPKGTEIEHRSVIRLLFGIDYVQLDSGTRVLHASSISFDASTFEIWSALLHGGCCVLLPDKYATADLFRKMIVTQGVNTLWVSSPLFNSLVDEDPDAFLGVNQLLVGGDALSTTHIKRAQHFLPGTQLINGYGPTESTTFTCCFPIPDNFVCDSTRSIPIGKPIGNTRVYLLDNKLNPVAIGEPGELYVSGDGLARAYSHQPKMTAGVFLPDPFSAEPGARMYRTGDIALYRANGEIEYVGRADEQIKIRGFRVEPREVEVNLLELPSVQAALVIPDTGKGGLKCLTAYVIPEDNQQLDTNELSSLVRLRLPEYMAPEFIVLLDSFPLSSTGKIDRQKLPKPGRESIEKPAKAMAAPSTDTEKKLANIWQEVLETGEIGRESNLFQLGAHSLILIKIASRIRSSLKATISLDVIFQSPTLRLLAAAIDKERAGEYNDYVSLTKVSRDSDLPQSQEQQRLWFIDQFEENLASYNVQACWYYPGLFQFDQLKAALEHMVDRHEILRTSFEKKSVMPVQVIHGSVEVPVTVASIERKNKVRLNNMLRNMVETPFTLSQGPLWNVHLIEEARSCTYFVLNMHHIITDGWSISLFIKEFCHIYESLSQGKAVSLNKKAFDYVDYTIWQDRWLKTGKANKQLEFWKSQLEGASPLLELPTDFARSSSQKYTGRILKLDISPELSAQIEVICTRKGCTPFHFFLAVYYVLLSKYSGQDDISVGCPVANRDTSELESVFGLFVNTLVLRLNSANRQNFSNLIDKVKETSLDAIAHSGVPFEKVVEAVNPERSLTHSPLFQAMFSLNEFDSGGEIDGVTLSNIDIERWFSKFDLTLNLNREKRGWSGILEYRTELFRESTVRRMLDAYIEILGTVVSDIDIKIENISALSSSEYKKIILDWNRMAMERPADRCIHELIESQAEKTPNNIAVNFKGETISYKHLSERSGRLACYLQSLGVGPEVRVGVCLSRSTEMLTTLLGVLKAGGTYVPIDLAYPAERIQYIIEDSCPKILIAEKGIEDQLQLLRNKNELLMLTLEACIDKMRQFDSSMLKQQVMPNNLAYVIYTSGSTGKPKGVAITHANTVQMLTWGRNEYSPQDLLGVLASTSICFDLSIFEMFLPLACGGTVLLVENALDLLSVEFEAPVTLVNTVPSAIAAILNVGDLPNSIRVVNLAGEALSRKLVNRIHASSDSVRVYNLYGPSEDTTYSTWAIAERDTQDKPLIGRPLPGSQCYVLDEYMQPVPAGTQGELYLGGAGVSRGYLGKPSLTAERYLPSPFSDDEGERLYRTGDVVRYLPGGELEYLGRNDHQIKLRGFRIELGEIEQVISAIEWIDDVALKLWYLNESDMRLVAYITCNKESTTGRSELQHALSRVLPHYMVPSEVIVLKKMPITANGKIDREALILPDVVETDSAWLEPVSETTKVVAGIWEKLLHKKVAANSDFFEMGGHSLLVIQLTTKLEEILGIKLSMKDVFQYPQPGLLADFIDSRLWADFSRKSQANHEDNQNDAALEIGEL